MSAVEVVAVPASDLSTIVADAFEIPCRKSDAHPPAVWAVWFVQRDVCCNPPQPEHETPQFACDPCLQRFRKGLTCPHCGAPAGSFAELVTRVERIKP